jgi:uncharacterized protein with ParB-like and HNH nuclease domain
LNTISYFFYLKAEGAIKIPDFQRALVWTESQKIRFMESLILDLPIGEYCLHESEDQLEYEVLDGLQRWSAIEGYFADEFPVFELKYSELNRRTKIFLDQRVFPVRMVKGLNYDQRKSVYCMLAYGGTPHEPREDSRG